MANLGVDLFTPKNPNVPYLKIKVKGKIYDLDINYVKDFSLTRQANDVGNYSFTLVDVMDLNLEYKFMMLIKDRSERLSFQYGWSFGEKSPWYVGTIDNYEPVFLSNMNMSLTIKGTLMPEDRRDYIQSYKGKSISDIVAQIANQFGWTIQALDKTDTFSEERTFNIGNIDPIVYIREKLLPEASDNGVPFNFYIESVSGNGSNGCDIYFVRTDHFSAVHRNYNFMINCGNYGSVISFSPQYTGLDIANLGQEAAFFDEDTNEISVYGSEGEYAGNESGLTVYGSTSPDRMKALLSNKWFEENLGYYKATLEIYGDPTIQCLRYINVLPMRPNGEIHHTGGTYLVLQITDTISGAFKTTLELQKADYVDENGRNRTISLEDTVTFREKV